MLLLQGNEFILKFLHGHTLRDSCLTSHPSIHPAMQQTCAGFLLHARPHTTLDPGAISLKQNRLLSQASCPG